MLLESCLLNELENIIDYKVNIHYLNVIEQLFNNKKRIVDIYNAHIPQLTKGELYIVSSIDIVLIKRLLSFILEIPYNQIVEGYNRVDVSIGTYIDNSALHIPFITYIPQIDNTASLYEFENNSVEFANKFLNLLT